MKKYLQFLLNPVAIVILFTLSCTAGNHYREVAITENNNWSLDNIKISANGDIKFNDNYTDVIANVGRCAYQD